MKKVCHFTSVHRAGDVRITVKECSALAEAGYEVHLVAAGLLPAYAPGIIHHVLPEPPECRILRSTLGAWRAYRKATEVDADIYHFHDPELIPHGCLLKLAGKRVVYDVHEDVPKDIQSKEWLPLPVRWIVRLLMDLAERLCSTLYDAVVAATPSIARRFPASTTSTVCNYPLPEEVCHEPLSSYSDRPCHFAYIGQISLIRGCREMVSAVHLLGDWNVRLEWAGSVSPPETLTLLEQMQGWDKVDFHGWMDRPEVAKLLSRVRGGLVVFRPEPNHLLSQPNKLFEYMAAGLPVIASDFPLWREIITDALCGLLVDPLDPRDIARAIQWMIENPADAAAMGLRGRAAVVKRYSWASQKELLLRAYAELLLT